MRQIKFKHYLLLLFCCLATSFQAQEKYHRVSIDLTKTSLHRLQELEIGIDHFSVQKQRLICEISDRDIQVLNQEAVSYNMLITDMQSYYEQRNLKSEKTTTTTDCAGISDVDLDKYTVPSQFNLGSMGGYFTYAEFLAHLDNMSTLYPNLITVKQPIDTFLTHENRPLYWLKISDNPNIDETEPEVLYTAIHHAREPVSLSQLIFFMYYVLENYNTNPQIKALVDSTEMYFVPMINPDGYNYNYTIAPGGGGMWRKNRRNNGDSSYGVDLNRNYSYEWGGLGASTNTTNDTYRGLFAFSEPETRAIKYFVEHHSFLFTLNYHTFSNLLLYPFGYDVNQPSPDDAYFKAFTPIMVSENHFSNIISSELYPASGDSDDWMYGDSTKPKVFAMTPEVGTDMEGFWPSSSDIIRLCQENVLANITLIKLTHQFADVHDSSNVVLNHLQSYLPYSIRCLGLDTPSTFSVGFAPLTSNVVSVGPTRVFSNMDLMDLQTDSVFLDLSPSIQNGDTVRFLRTLDFGLYVQTDTIIKLFYNYNQILLDSGNSMSNWVSGVWNTSSVKYYSPSHSIADSPIGPYSSDQNSSIQYVNDVDLTLAIGAFVKFKATWDIENDYDYVQFQASLDHGSTWIPLCGQYTNSGSVNQDYENPLYDGTSDWISEFVDLHDFLGQTIQLRFQLVSDPFQEGDGFYFDDFEIDVVLRTDVKKTELIHNQLVIYPNPSTNSFSIKGLPSGTYQISIHDLLGKEVMHLTSNGHLQNIPLSLIPGVYHVLVKNEAGERYSAKLLVE